MSAPPFRQITPTLYASPQITVGDVATAKALGIGTIVNNRPDGETDDQTPGAAIEAAAMAAGIAYRAIPVTHAGFSQNQVVAMAAALEAADGPVLAYCRSGTRSTLLWALAEASRGGDAETIAAQALQAGYDVGPIRGAMDMLSPK